MASCMHVTPVAVMHESIAVMGLYVCTGGADMSASLMIHNGKGWRRVGKCARGSNEGHGADTVGFYAGPEGYVSLAVGEHVDAYTRKSKSAINSALSAAGWDAYTLNDARKHAATGAVIEIERNFWVDMDELPAGWKAGDPTKVKVVARFTRTA